MNFFKQQETIINSLQAKYVHEDFGQTCVSKTLVAHAERHRRLEQNKG